MNGERVLGLMKPARTRQHLRAARWSTSTRALAALDRGTLAGLALDVLPVEPVPATRVCSRIRVLF
jgi:phosphoglycerate dehydrogenase-like enzyme